MDFLLYLLVFAPYFLIPALIFGLIGLNLAVPGRKTMGFWISFFLGPIGLIIAAIAKPHAAPAPPVRRRVLTARPTIIPPPLPETFTIRRGGHTYGPYTLEEVIAHLSSGLLLPTDHYQTTAGHWALLSKTGLI